MLRSNVERGKIFEGTVLARDIEVDIREIKSRSEEFFCCGAGSTLR